MSAAPCPARSATADATRAVSGALLIRGRSGRGILDGPGSAAHRLRCVRCAWEYIRNQEQEDNRLDQMNLLR